MSTITRFEDIEAWQTAREAYLESHPQAHRMYEDSGVYKVYRVNVLTRKHANRLQ